MEAENNAMKNFARALKEAWRHWPALAAAMACSFGVAALWGGNIAALGPIIETTLNGHSLQEWNRQRLDKSQERLAEKAGRLAALDEQLAAANGAERQQLTLQRGALEAQIQLDQKGVEWSKWLQPWFDAVLPDDPFKTVVFLVTLVVIATALKHVCLLDNIMLVTHVSQSVARDIRRRIFDK